MQGVEPDPTALPVALRSAMTADPAGASSSLAFDALYVTYMPVLRNIAMRKFGIPRGDAEDLVHDVFATYLVRETEVRNPPAYLYNAIRNASQRHGRRSNAARNRQQSLDDALPSGAEDLGDEVMRDVAFRATMAKLGPICRDTLYRFHVLGEKASSIAESREKKENYIYRLLNYCRNRARDIYRQMNQESA
jgi:RNA polymerase sigma factor (sigma-70 family)